jgi:flagellar biosynthesis protein FlhF
MKLKTYVGRSLEELAPQIRDELGPEAVILSQRQGLKGGVGGFFGTKSIEVLAADRMPTADEQAGFEAAPEMSLAELPEPEIVLQTDAERKALVTAALSEIKARQMPAAHAAAAYSAPLDELELPDFAGSIGPVENVPVIEPVPVVEATVSEPLVLERRRADAGMHLGPRRAMREQTPAGPSSDDAVALLDELDRAGVATEIARAVVESAERHLRPFQPEAPLRELVRARIRSIVRVESGWGGEGQRSLAVVGPTGAGKTTVLLKLAERYCAAGLSVGIIALETSSGTRSTLQGRSGDGLDDSVTFDLRRAGSISAVRAALRAFADHDAVLIDTPGSAINDAASFEALKTLLDECGVDELHAVIPLGIADRELEHVLDRMIVELGANRVLATKLDEARFMGALLTIAASSQLPLAYLGTGPRIPDDLEVADGGSICDRILSI